MQPQNIFKATIFWFFPMATSLIFYIKNLLLTSYATLLLALYCNVQHVMCSNPPTHHVYNHYDNFPPLWINKFKKNNFFFFLFKKNFLGFCF